MTVEEVEKRYSSTIERFLVGGKPNPLHGVKIDGCGGTDYAGVHLALCLQLGDPDDNDKLRFVIREYFGHALKSNESMRVWLGIGRGRRESGVDFSLQRNRDVLSFNFSNEDVVQLIRHWCADARVDVS